MPELSLYAIEHTYRLIEGRAHISPAYKWVLIQRKLLKPIVGWILAAPFMLASDDFNIFRLKKPAY